MYMESNEPYNPQETQYGFDWAKAGGAFVLGAGSNFAQDVVLNHATKYGAQSNNKTVAKYSQLYQDLFASDIQGKMTDNVGVQRIINKAERSYKGSSKDGKWINSKFVRNTLGKLPNAVPGTTSGKIMGYGVIPLAGALFAGFTGETASEAATKTASKTLLGE